jgi:Na+/H+ antiporter NhaD/arsenite permease-like protein
MLLIVIFITGYLLITVEHKIGLNKAATALVTGVLCWVAYLFNGAGHHQVVERLMEHLGEVSGILFFLLGAMTVVELIDVHDGFHLVTRAIRTRNKRKILWIVAIITFFLSAVLDNLTTTILMVSIMRKLVDEKEQRWYYLGMVIIAANAGGAWSPIGDVTTTMLWIGGQITTMNIVSSIFLPSLLCMMVPLAIASIKLKGHVAGPLRSKEMQTTVSAFQRNTIFFSGIAILVLIPVFKTVTHLPPFMGMLLGLGVLWIISELLHKNRDTTDKDLFSVVYALRKIDTPSILFFLGILLAICALQAAGMLTEVARRLDDSIGHPHHVAILIGLFSAIVDNVPLVAASIGMYDLSRFPTDHTFWEFLAYTSGTGGSALIIGSAAGVAVMGMENMSFFWYLKKISWLALCGFFAGAVCYMYLI